MKTDGSGEEDGDCNHSIVAKRGGRNNGERAEGRTVGRRPCAREALLLDTERGTSIQVELVSIIAFLECVDYPITASQAVSIRRDFNAVAGEAIEERAIRAETLLGGEREGRETGVTLCSGRGARSAQGGTRLTCQRSRVKVLSRHTRYTLAIRSYWIARGAGETSRRRGARTGGARGITSLTHTRDSFWKVA